MILDIDFQGHFVILLVITPYMHFVHQITFGWYKYLFMKYWLRGFERTSALVHPLHVF